MKLEQPFGLLFLFTILPMSAKWLTPAYAGKTQDCTRPPPNGRSERTFLYLESNIFLHFGISEANESEETSGPKISNSINDREYDAKNA